MEKIRRSYEDIYPGGPTYVRGVRAGDFLFISGCTARNSDAEGGPAMSQLRVVLDRITRMVEAEGGKPSDIVRLTTYVTNMAHWWPIEEDQRQIYEEHFKGEFPTNSYVEVSALAEPGLDVEIDTVAVLD